MRELLTRLVAAVTNRPLRPAALVSTDGAFHCSPDHAVELAYMLSTAEAHVTEMEEYGEPRGDGRKRMRLKNPYANQEVADLIAEYLTGQMTPAEVMAEIRNPA